MKTSNRSGFTLVELMVAITITGFMAYALVQIYSSIQRASSYISTVIEEDTGLGIIDSQFEKDINGIFVPVNIVPTQQKKEEQKKPQAPGQKQQPKFSYEPEKNALVSVNEGDRLDKVSFITNNPLQVYGQSIPKIVRVEYSLEPDEDGVSFNLFRKQSEKYGLDGFKEADPRGYKLLGDIKSMKVDYFAIKKPDEEEQKKQAAEKKEEDDEPERKRIPEHIWVPIWNDEVQETHKEIIPGFLPLAVHFTIEVFSARDKNRESFKTYNLYYMIYAFDSGTIAKQTELPEQEKPQQQPPATPPGKGGKGPAAPARGPAKGPQQGPAASPNRNQRGGVHSIARNNAQTALGGS